MENLQDDFGPFNGHIWLNSASEGPLPRVALDALNEAGGWKSRPYQLTQNRFREVPQRLKSAAARLLNVQAEDLILGNSATYGIHLLANGLSFEAGDEILVMQNDFPTNILPWLFLEEDGVIVRQVQPRSCVLEPDELAGHLRPRTKLVCLSHVHTFSGHILDIGTIGRICRERNILFVANLSQSLGYMTVDLSTVAVDAVTTAAFKWLCGPYATGFCWIKPELRRQLNYPQAHWANVLSSEELQKTGPVFLSRNSDSRRYDVFGTANFFNFHPLAASIEYLLGIGIERIRRHNDELVEFFIENIDQGRFQLISPAERERRSALVVFSHRQPEKNREIFAAMRNARIYGAFWKGNIRVSPHLFNTREDMTRLLATINQIR